MKKCQFYLNNPVLVKSVFKCRESNFFSRASRTQALAYPIWVFISVIAWTFRISKINDSGRGLSCSGPIDFLSPGVLFLSVPLVGETSVSKARFDKSKIKKKTENTSISGHFSNLVVWKTTMRPKCNSIKNSRLNRSILSQNTNFNSNYIKKFINIVINNMNKFFKTWHTNIYKIRIKKKSGTKKDRFLIEHAQFL